MRGPTVGEILDHLRDAGDRHKGARLQPEAVYVVLRILERATDVLASESADQAAARFILTGSWKEPEAHPAVSPSESR